MPQLRKPEYYTLRDLTQVLKVEQVEVCAVLLRRGRGCGIRQPDGSNS